MSSARPCPLFQSLIERGIASGEFRKVDPRLTVKCLVGPMLLGRHLEKRLRTHRRRTHRYLQRWPPTTPISLSGHCNHEEVHPGSDHCPRCRGLLFQGYWLPQPPGQANYLGYVEGETVMIAAPQAGRIPTRPATKGARSRRARPCSAWTLALPRQNAPVRSRDPNRAGPA